MALDGNETKSNLPLLHLKDSVIWCPGVFFVYVDGNIFLHMRTSRALPHISQRQEKTISHSFKNSSTRPSVHLTYQSKHKPQSGPNGRLTRSLARFSFQLDM